MGLIAVCAAVGLIAIVPGCTFRASSQPSILVIGVEGLGFGAFTCSEDLGFDQGSGFRALCDESVRFTHAYAPSTMSQPTLASVFTGLMPFEHGLRHNGGQGLSASYSTAAEEALRKGYQTSFFSGGPPIWRKSGLNQGFEIFDDNVQPAPSRLYRPARDLVNLFLAWQEREAPRGKFFSALFLSDLQFIDVPTVNALGELRESSYGGQVTEVGESLAVLVRQLKARKVWDDTTVFLVGTNGFAQEPRVGETKPVNLYSESTRVTLMIKPARKFQGPKGASYNTVMNWKVDENVGLADVGATIFDLLGVPRPQALTPTSGELDSMRAVSLTGALLGPQAPAFESNRLVLSESAWSAWREEGGIRHALRRGSYLYLQESKGERALLFNTLTDSLEASPLPEGDARASEARAELKAMLESLARVPWLRSDHATIDKLELGHRLWHPRAPTTEIMARLKELVRREPGDEQLRGWRAIVALRMDAWGELKAAAAKPVNKPLWAFVAARNLGEKIEVPNEPCLAFLKGQPVSKACAATGLNQLLTWRDESLPAAERDRAMDAFMRRYLTEFLGQRISEANYVAGLTWDVSLERLNEPSVIDLILALPELRKARAVVARRLASVAIDR